MLNNNEFMLKDTFDFVNKLSGLESDTHVMVSFDIESLFTNIPIDETINIIVNYFFKTPSSKLDNLNKKTFIELLRICTQKSQFQLKVIILIKWMAYLWAPHLDRH